MALKCLILDCDGVILESMDIKDRAFELLSEPFGKEAQEKLMLYHKLNYGMSRRVKLVWFYNELFGREPSAEETADFLRKFQDIALKALYECPLVPGIMETLQAWKGRIPIYVCSGAPHDELNDILAAKNLSSYFDGIFGSPPGKTELLRQIVNSTGFEPEECVMVGDSSTDLRAAEAVGTLFYGRGRDLMGGSWPCEENLVGLSAWLEETHRGGA